MRMLSRLLPPSAVYSGMLAALPKMSHSAMSMAELPRVSTPDPRQPR